MRVLWFAVTPSLYAENDVAHNGGGWIESLERLVRAVPGVELGVAFEHPDEDFRVDRNGVAYYPIPVNRRPKNRLLTRLHLPLEERNLIPWCLRIIEDFRPDVIHVFGSEWCFGLLAQHTAIPVVIHMQGSLPAYYNARLPPGFSTLEVLRRSVTHPAWFLKYAVNDFLFKRRAEREKRVLAGCRYFMGRTEWDRAIVNLYQPQARYFHCDEVLRPEFYAASGTWRDAGVGKIRIVSVLSSPLYKGVDLVLKAAQLLKFHAGMDFEWMVYGIRTCELQEAVTGVRASEVGVRLMGVAPAAQIRAALCEASVYVHPSYIDNSPNSLCEAQLTGVPVVAANVGGVGSLIEHGVSGLLVPANEPHMLAFSLRALSQDEGLRRRLSSEAHRRATQRHLPAKILAELVGVYRAMLGSPPAGAAT